MSTNINFDLSFKSPSPLVSSLSKCFRPPSWPPPPDWVISIDHNGNDKSKYSDDVWDFTDIEKRTKCNFLIPNLDSENKELFKQTLVFLAYRDKAPRALISTYGGNNFSTLKKLFCLCSENNILANEVSRYPKIIENFIQIISPTGYSSAVSTFHTLYQLKDKLGFVLLNERAISMLVALEPNNKSETVQTPYIPPRIWNYQLMRVNEFLDDFIQLQDKLVQLYDFASDGYKQNIERGFAHVSPFFDDENRYKFRTYIGSFEENLLKLSLLDFFKKWLTPLNKRIFTIQDLSSLFTLAKMASFIFILNFSLQRKGEALDLRVDCWTYENDEKLGRIGLLIGETTKTNIDDDARWVVPPQVEKAVTVAKLITKLRVRYFTDDVPSGIRENPYLFTNATEPWASGPKGYYPSIQKLMDFAYQPTNKLFEMDKFRIREEDWKIALTLTPNLYSKHGFERGVGSIWQLSFHQYRRTTNVNMFTSGLISDVSMQWQMKHSSRIMPLYYARNYSYISLNKNAEKLLIKEMYQAIYRNIVDISTDISERYIIPQAKKFNDHQIVNIVNSSEEKKLIKLINNGEKGCRKTLLGFCMTRDTCEYGGIESISKCVGGDAGKICLNAVFDKNNEHTLLHLQSKHVEELKTIKSDSPRYKAIKEEVYAIEVYLNVINSKENS